MHPDAASALDALAALGAPLAGIGAARAIQGTEGPLVFAGLGWLLGNPSFVPLHVEPDPGSVVIREAAWAEVAAIVHLLGTRPAARDDFASAVAAGAPAEYLAAFGVAGTRDPRQLLRRLNVPPRARAPGQKIFDRARIRFTTGR